MANMSYCRMENTFKDLQDCLNNIDNVSSDSEIKYRRGLAMLCEEFMNKYQDIDDMDDDE